MLRVWTPWNTPHYLRAMCWRHITCQRRGWVEMVQVLGWHHRVSRGHLRNQAASKNHLYLLFDEMKLKQTASLRRNWRSLCSSLRRRESQRKTSDMSANQAVTVVFPEAKLLHGNTEGLTWLYLISFSRLQMNVLFLDIAFVNRTVTTWILLTKAFSPGSLT